MTRLQALHVRAFRGIPDLTLPFDGGSIVLGGGNGTGKSAVVDALEFLYTGSIVSLAGTQGLSLREHGPHIQARAADTCVSGTFSDPGGVVTRQLIGGVETAPALQAHVLQGQRLAFVLRRVQLQHFIHATPADRYRSMADLFGAEDLQRTETALKHAWDMAEREAVGIRAQLAQVELQLSDLPEDAAEQDVLHMANEALAGAGSAYTLSDVTDAARVRTEVLRAVAAQRANPQTEAMNRLQVELERGIGGTRVRAALAEYLALLAGPPGGAPAHGLELLQLLRRGREYVSQTHGSHCPLCRQNVDEHDLLAQLVARVARLEEVSLHDQRLTETRQALRETLDDLLARLRTLEGLQRPANVEAPRSPLANWAHILRESLRAGTFTESREMAARFTEALDEWEAWSAETIGALQARLGGGDDDRLRGLQSVLAVLDEVTRRQTTAERVDQQRKQLCAEQERLARSTAVADRAIALAEASYTTFNRVKNETIQQIYDDLRADLVELYDQLHPGEGHGMLAIAMDPRKRGSADLRMGFYGREGGDPRAFASEGHLDSLGLCIFLAFVRRFNGDWPLLVLDDVVTSVDAAHKQRVARLLFAEFGERQLLVTTHDARWFLELKRAQEEFGRTNVQNLVLEAWSLQDGPRVRIDK